MRKVESGDGDIQTSFHRPQVTLLVSLLCYLRLKEQGPIAGAYKQVINEPNILVFIDTSFLIKELQQKHKKTQVLL
jgi:hypothetical protein